MLPRDITIQNLLYLFGIMTNSGGHLVYRSGTIFAILIGSCLGNIPMKFESNWPKGLEKIEFKAKYLRFSIFSSGGHFVDWSETILSLSV